MKIFVLFNVFLVIAFSDIDSEVAKSKQKRIDVFIQPYKILLQSDYKKMLFDEAQIINAEIFRSIHQNQEIEKLARFLDSDFKCVLRGVVKDVESCFETIKKYSKYLTIPVPEMLNASLIVQKSYYSITTSEYRVNFGSMECKIVTNNTESRPGLDLVLAGVDAKCKEIYKCTRC